MAVTEEIDSGRHGAREIAVWDPLVRLIHWSLALCILLNGTIIEDESDLHEWIGYTAAGLVIIRFTWGLIGPRHARFSAFPPNPFTALRYLSAKLKGNKTVHLSHNPIGALMVYNIWITVLALGVTGYMMGTMKFFGIKWVEDIHEIAFNWLVISIVLHIGGVMLHTWRSGVPLVQAMIDGRKRVPKDRLIE